MQIHEGLPKLQQSLQTTQLLDAPEPDAAELSIPEELIVALAKGDITHREALGVSSESVQRLAEYAYRLLEHEHFEPSAVLFDGLVTLDPNVSYFHLGLGTALRSLGERMAAHDHYDKAKQLDPRDITPHVNQAQMHLEDGKYREARRLLEEAKKLDPKGRHPLSHEVRKLWITQIEPM